MDAEGQPPTQPTQATQTVLDPRRIGKQNSGFSDDDVSDIICVLYPHSQAARLEVQQLAASGSPYIIGKDEADGVEVDYDAEDDASRFDEMPQDLGSHALILRLSSPVKNPAAGFRFGRNGARCDVVFANDPLRRVSNIHFRIYINEYGTVMVEDHSTNGTTVDNNLLISRPRDPAVANDPDRKTKWMLSSGSIVGIYLQDMRHLSFRVRIPRRENEFDLAYQRRVDAYFARQALRGGPVETVTTGPGGHVDLFGGTAAQNAQAALAPAPNAQAAALRVPDRQPPEQRSPSKRKEARVAQRQWTGSGKYNKIGMIGKGAFAVVYKVTSKYNGVPYAAKELEKRRFIKNGVLDQKVENEMRIMQKVDHPNIVRYIENFDWDDRLLIIIMEYVPGGDLGKHIADDMPFSESDSREMAKQLLSALSYLHANNITHRDVKPDNILINSLQPLDVKLTDFGLSKMVDTEQTFLRTFCGTLLYCAPEVYTEYAEYDENGVRSRGKKARRVPGQRYNHAVDIWSLGGVLFYSMTGQPPYPVKSGISYSELLHKIMTTLLDIRPLERRAISDDGIDFICSMLQRKPENRGTIDELFRHSWLTPLYIQASPQSFDVVSDDEGVMSDPPPEYREHEYEDPFEFDRVSDSNGEDEEEEEEARREEAGQGRNKGKEPEDDDTDNDMPITTRLEYPIEEAMHIGTQRPRLFGEIGASAVGNSGAVPEDHLNLPVTNGIDSDSGSGGGGGGAEGELDEAYDSGDSGATLVKRNDRRFLRHGTSMSIGRHQSADQLQSLVEEVASQKLNGNESPVKLSDASNPTTPSMDFNTSKRKTSSSLEASDELDLESTPTGKPVIKRLKSESFSQDVSAQLLEEYRLLASMPPIKKSNSGRQIDQQVTKTLFWQQDRSTWHLNYPEMTQLQYDAFVQAARNRKEEFGPNNKPLWDLAMRYFPPTPPTTGSQISRTQDEDVLMDIPSTGEHAAGYEDPDAGRLDTQRVVPVQTNSGSRAIGMITSHEKSCIKKIEMHITDSLISFGRGVGNTVVFQPKTNTRVPKHAFKILLWKDGYDPAKDAHPWKDDLADAADSYFFWISTKATIGISVNGQRIASSNPAKASAPSINWAKIYNEDVLDLWHSEDGREQTKLVFQCFWGGSRRKREEDSQRRLEMASVAAAKVLDVACQRTERRIREAAALKQDEERGRDGADSRQAEKLRIKRALEADDRERLQRIDIERNRSHVFEQSRLAAIQFLAARQGSLLPSSRKGSSSSSTTTTTMYAGYSIR
ncbi:Pkinase-domain-containing protein [Trichoderma reesei RUT C-30]|uniref:Autophagy-related protein 1 n=1 Tax=Hypocrea jecorina (strain ATCC 56765 / BCRC 32924 / NRRL 11460 / Rut C-30) TaxID=1344414 RepID=A0A024SJ22_HYPJR|nr:Pkinase-domain-containing protein [Trichoderma reesei RUT C-30]